VKLLKENRKYILYGDDGMVIIITSQKSVIYSIQNTLKKIRRKTK
tara:strand:+ start:462 stop:596 length:135 start_codon:yes stop_codon:yes gene_type:complete